MNTAKSSAETSANAVKTTTEKKDAADTTAANSVADTINNLPASGDVTTADKDAIETARTAYDALTDVQKAKVSTDTLQKLTDAETALEVAQTELYIRYDANGGSGSMSDQEFEKEVETELNTNTFTREGYSFKEWNT